MKQQKTPFPWKEFWLFSKYGWVTLFLTLFLGLGAVTEMSVITKDFSILYPTFLAVVLTIILLVIFTGILLGFVCKISEIRSELLGAMGCFTLPLVMVFFRKVGILQLKHTEFFWWVCFLFNQVVIVHFIQLSVERIRSWKLRKKRYERVRDLMATRKAYDPAIEKILSLTCDREIVKKLQDDFQKSQKEVTFDGE